MAESISIDGYTVRLTNLSKVLWPATGFTKADLIRYIIDIGPHLLLHLRDRPLTVRRFPDGVHQEGFYQKNRPSHAPEWVESYLDTDSEQGTEYILANHLATLVWLANQGSIEYHPWMAPYERPERPDFAVVDLDPGPQATFEDARHVASRTRELLDELGLTSLPKTSGATGIHIYIPLEPIYSYSTTSRFVGLLGQILAEQEPLRVTTERRVADRPPDTVYVDPLQNLRGKTVAAPYSPRPVAAGTVSAPFDWADLPDIHPHDFTLRSAAELLSGAEPFERRLHAGRQRLEPALARLRSDLLTPSAPLR